MDRGRLLVAGKLVVDEVLTCREPPTPGSSQRAAARSVTGGGQVWHTARAALGAAAVGVAVTGWCGSDADTARLRGELTDLGIHDLLVPTGEAVRAVVLVGPDGERTIVSTGGAAVLPVGALDHEALLTGTGWLHLDGFCLDDRSGAALTALAAAAYERDVPVSLEPPSLASLPARTGWLRALTPLAAMVGRPDELEAVVALLGTAPGCRVAHDGPSPVVTTTGDGEQVTTPVPQVAVTTTGAGDRFTGGWLAARLHGAGLDEAAAAGVAAAHAG